MEGDCVIDFCLERDAYNSGHSKTNAGFSVLIGVTADLFQVCGNCHGYMSMYSIQCDSRVPFVGIVTDIA